MSKNFTILLIFIFITNCSFQKNSEFWNKQKIEEETKENLTEIFKKEETLNFEFNPTLKIELDSRAVNNSVLNSLDNNHGKIDFDGKLENISKYKFKKITNFFEYESEITFNRENVIFFDNEGSILSFDKNSNLKWKKNYYLKSEKKQNPFLFFGYTDRILVIADNVAKLYAININTGELLWEKKKYCSI